MVGAQFPATAKSSVHSLKSMIRFFRHYIPASLLLLAVIEFLIMVASFYGGLQSQWDGRIAQIRPPALSAALFYAGVSFVFFIAFGLYDWESLQRTRSMLLRLAGSILLSCLLLIQLYYWLPSLHPGQQAFIISIAATVAGVVSSRIFFLHWSNLEALKKRVLVLGTGSRAARIEQLLTDKGLGGGIHVVGYLPMGGAHHYVEHARVLPQTDSLASVVDKYHIDEIIIAVRDRRGGTLPVAELLDCKLMGIKVMELSSFFEREKGHLQLESMNASWMIFAEGFHQGIVRDTVKRVFDLLVSALVMALTFPIMLIAALAIRMDSRGPVLYRQERIGQHGETFTIYKFRSMFCDAEKDGKPRWAGKNDDRTTNVGRTIRRLRIDELPQLFNVFLGQMSFVGPRPERPFFVNKLSEQIPYYGARHTVKPGITGWAQVKYSYGASLEDAIEKLQYDLYYVKNHSLFLDIMILLMTVEVVLFGKGAR
jgi:sugar transferase (PEP-CTERM system associated)